MNSETNYKTLRVNKETHHKIKLMATIRHQTINNLLAELINKEIEQDELIKQLITE